MDQVKPSPGNASTHRSHFGVPCLRRVRLPWWLLLALGLVLPSPTQVKVEAQPERPSEFQVKAAYLYNFGKFVRWGSRSPQSTDFDICVLGKDPFGGVLESTLAGETLDGKKVRIERLQRISDINRCRIVFVGASEQLRVPAVVAAAAASGTLTVGDIPRFAERGGMIGFVMQQDKVRFEVNRNAAEQAGLGFSSELLKVATRVIEKK